MSFAEQLTSVSLTRQEELIRRQAECKGRLQDAFKIQTEFDALCDFDEYWLPSFKQAVSAHSFCVDSRRFNHIRNDRWYGNALYDLLQQKFPGQKFGIVQVKRLLRRPYVRVSWGK